MSGRPIWCAFAFLLCVPPAGATVMVATDLGELARDAQTIARGRIDTVEGRWADDHHGIETVVTLQVESELKGQAGPTVQFCVPGGRAGHYRTIFVGAPNFAVGDRVIVFLGRREPSMPYVLGLSQGVYRVISAPDGRTLVTPPPFLPVASTTSIVRGDGARVPLLLAEFEQRVRRLATGGAR